jgi:succinate dehydrogenase / fumarate reductase membrane anchor subunit
MKGDRGLNSGGAGGWFLQRLTGVLLIPVVLTHIWVTHYVMAGGFHAGEVSYERVAERLGSAGWKLIDLFFLGVVLFHGLRGVWIVVQEGIRAPWARVTLYYAILVLGAALAILGTVTILPFRAS